MRLIAILDKKGGYFDDLNCLGKDEATPMDVATRGASYGQHMNVRTRQPPNSNHFGLTFHKVVTYDRG